MLQTTLKSFKKADFTTVREHDEFVWLHDRFVENEEYAGIIVSQKNVTTRDLDIIENNSFQIPPPPPKPDFNEPRHKLARLREGKCLHTPPSALLYMSNSAMLIRIPYNTLLSLCYEGEDAMTKEEYTKMKQELEA